MDDARVKALSKFGLHLDPPSALGRLDPNHVAIFDAKVHGRVRMDREGRLRGYFSEPGNLSVGCVEIDHVPATGNQDEGVLLCQFGGRDWGFRIFLVKRAGDRTQTSQVMKSRVLPFRREC